MKKFYYIIPGTIFKKEDIVDINQCKTINDLKNKISLSFGLPPDQFSIDKINLDDETKTFDDNFEFKIIINNPTKNVAFLLPNNKSIQIKGSNFMKIDDVIKSFVKHKYYFSPLIQMKLEFKLYNTTIPREGSHFGHVSKRSKVQIIFPADYMFLCYAGKEFIFCENEKVSDITNMLKSAFDDDVEFKIYNYNLNAPLNADHQFSKQNEYTIEGKAFFRFESGKVSVVESMDYRSTVRDAKKAIMNSKYTNSTSVKIKIIVNDKEIEDEKTELRDLRKKGHIYYEAEEKQPDWKTPNQPPKGSSNGQGDTKLQGNSKPQPLSQQKNQQKPQPPKFQAAASPRNPPSPGKANQASTANQATQQTSARAGAGANPSASPKGSALVKQPAQLPAYQNDTNERDRLKANGLKDKNEKGKSALPPLSPTNRNKQKNPDNPSVKAGEKPASPPEFPKNKNERDKSALPPLFPNKSKDTKNSPTEAEKKSPSPPPKDINKPNDPKKHTTKAEKKSPSPPPKDINKPNDPKNSPTEAEKKLSSPSPPPKDINKPNDPKNHTTEAGEKPSSPQASQDNQILKKRESKRRVKKPIIKTSKVESDSEKCTRISFIFEQKDEEGFEKEIQDNQTIGELANEIKKEHNIQYKFEIKFQDGREKVVASTEEKIIDIRDKIKQKIKNKTSYVLYICKIEPPPDTSETLEKKSKHESQPKSESSIKSEEDKTKSEFKEREQEEEKNDSKKEGKTKNDSGFKNPENMSKEEQSAADKNADKQKTKSDSKLEPEKVVEKLVDENDHMKSERKTTEDSAPKANEETPTKDKTEKQSQKRKRPHISKFMPKYTPVDTSEKSSDKDEEPSENTYMYKTNTDEEVHKITLCREATVRDFQKKISLENGIDDIKNIQILFAGKILTSSIVVEDLEPGEFPFFVYVRSTRDIFLLTAKANRVTQENEKSTENEYEYEYTEEEEEEEEKENDS